MMGLSVHTQTRIMISRSSIDHIQINRIKTGKSHSLLNDGLDMITSMPRIKPVIHRNDRTLNILNKCFIHMVELEGVEPSSKRGNHMLSTGLSLLGFSSHDLDRATGP